MLKKELILKNPLRGIDPEPGLVSAPYRFGMVIARAGVGKTALLVQIALDSLLRGHKVLHVSIGQTLDKAKTWYEDIFQRLAEDYRLEKAQEVHDEIARRRLIMTFKAASFSAPKLEERLSDLIYQDIFRPDCIVIDGYDFAGAERAAVEDIKDMTQSLSTDAWFSAVRHRSDLTVSERGVPAPCHAFEDLFDTVVLLEQGEGGVALKLLKNKEESISGDRDLLLDPATFFLKSEKA